jgi:GDP-D-mannose dehydratase
MKRTAMHAMLQQATHGSYVVAMGESHGVAEFVATVTVAADLAAAGTTLPDPRPRG